MWRQNDRAWRRILHAAGAMLPCRPKVREPPWRAAESRYQLDLTLGDVYSYIMKRTQIYVDEEQDESLAKRAAAAGVTKSTLIREAIEAYLKGPADTGLRLDRFRAAVRAAAGSADYLPDGKSYVESLRALDARRQEEIERRRRA